MISLGSPVTGAMARSALRAALLTGATVFALQPAAAEGWDPFPPTRFVNDFGGVGLIQTPSAQFAEDGQIYFGGSRVYPYERYFVTVQGTPWLEATLRYSSVDNRLYSDVPDFSGNQSFKDRGLDARVKLFGEGRIRPALAIGGRDFLGTGLFSSEYIVTSKTIGPVNATLGIGWGNMGTRGHIRNPLRLISESYADRGGVTQGGGALNGSYFKGERVSFFGGFEYETPLPGLTAKIEYDGNDYQTEALSNQFKVDSPINVGLDYRLRSWLHTGISFERGNRIGLKLAVTTNFNRRSRAPKIDPPAPPIPVALPVTSAEPAATPMPVTAIAPSLPVSAPALAAPIASAANPTLGADVDIGKLTTALALQGSGLLAADYDTSRVTLYVAQARFRNVATGLGRVSRAAFSVLPASYLAVTIVFVEGGLETMSATVYRSQLEEALTGTRSSSDELFMRTEFDAAPMALGDADYVRKTKPGFFYAIRPGLRTTLGRPEQFILYQLMVRLNASLEVARGLSTSGSLSLNVSDNFDKMKVDSDSLLPRVRSDIKEYLKQGKNSIPYLQADYNFGVAPGLYGHVYGGLLEEMFAGVGGEMLYRPYDANWAVGFDINYARQRDYDQLFSLRNYDVVTGHVSAFYHFERLEVDALVKAGRYLAKDWGATFQLSRTFKSGVTVGGFATFTDASAADFGEGRFDKGLFITIPLDILFIRNVRSGLGIAWKPLVRDGGQMLTIRRPLLGTTGSMNMYNMRRDWRDVLD